MRRNSRLGILDLQAKSRIPIFIAQILLRNSRIPYKKRGKTRISRNSKFKLYFYKEF